MNVETATETVDPAQGSCPAPLTETERVLLGHGSGGQLSASLIRDVIVPALGDATKLAGTDPRGEVHGSGGATETSPLEDAAVLGLGVVDVVVSTDSFVVSPLFFSGGDIGKLAVHGTINDVAMMGGDPLGLSLAFIIEEGFPLEDLRRITASVGEAAREAGVPVVTGDSKVVDRGSADGLFITTTGIGRRLPAARLSAALARPGDAVLLSGPIAQHGVTILSAREGLGFDGDVASDTRPLHRLAAAMLDAAGGSVHVMRDPTRGGLASALNEIAQASEVGVVIDEPAVPVPTPVAAACEMLGLDPLHVANEGCLVAFVDPGDADAVLAAMRSDPAGRQAVRIGEVVADHPGRVTARTLIGAERIVDMLIGEQLPRIC
ncbi:hydrogenase expression/formation protein HypE [Phytoactinopolyspora halotolerans]|uniref:Hydrogenase expression/formation protein HypE n=2 Tax=Phytoactinopolyspora halotolerans TaxID=1981512 RepID=A0A6L9S7L1_9ACTN|nr:hydrogenase expression/formation protein HypE [Phytoactinopolyspora halotolerans]